MNLLLFDIDLNADTPEFNNPTDIINYAFSICKKINFPLPDIKCFEKVGMNNYQIAYGITKVLYSQSFEEANKSTEEECKEIGLITDTEEALDRWSEIDSKYDGVFCVGKFMFLKWQAEKMMVDNAFQIFEADPKIKKQLAKNNADYLKVKNNWERPSIRSKVVDLAFKLRT